MRLSRGFGVVDAVWLPGAQVCVEDVDVAAGERDHGLVAAFPFAPFVGVEGSAGGVLQARANRSVGHEKNGRAA
ncbi:MAG TPA: hypothetical protein VFM41_15080 [Gaiella sp.]|jgi:hypothetical protein|nr:hypothetical protein [Gaiella sp.]